jgi:beta-glucanase (GH16 family)
MSRNGLVALGAGGVILIGLLAWGSLRATGFFAATEPDGGSLSGNASTVSDGTASGGKALQFNAPAPPPPSGGCATGVTGSSPACTLAPPASAGSGKHWNVTFSEEFNSTDYDHNKLTPCFDWNYGDCTSTFNQGYEHYLPSQVTVSGGAAHLVAAPLSPSYNTSACYNSSCTYKSGLLSTARKSGNDPANSYLYSFTYGYVESSLKVVNQQGFFVAWWMLPADPGYSYTYNGFRYEIDILEELGHDPTDMEMHYSWATDPNAYYSPNDTQKNGACADLDYSKAFHRFGVDWEPTFVAFYIDGVKCGQHNATANEPVPNVPMQLILNQMVSVNWQRSVNKPLLDTSLTSDLQSDYIRVYQQAPN